MVVMKLLVIPLTAPSIVETATLGTVVLMMMTKTRFTIIPKPISTRICMIMVRQFVLQICKDCSRACLADMFFTSAMVNVNIVLMLLMIAMTMPAKIPTLARKEMRVSKKVKIVLIA